jgi:heme/copper-type cytochrome/quinol oxidase subunit 2
MDVLNDLLPSFSWSLIGFITGWLVGREMLFFNRRVEAAVSDKEQTKPVRGNRLLGWVVIVLSVFTVLQGSYYAYETNRKASCQAQFNNDFAHVISLRAQWADEDKAAELKLFHDLLATTKPGQGGKILQDYLVSTERTDKLRRENPLPKLEDRGC